MSLVPPFSQNSATDGTTTESSTLSRPLESSPGTRRPNDDSDIDETEDDYNAFSVEYSWRDVPVIDLCDDLQESAGKRRRVADECHEDGGECKEGDGRNKSSKKSKPKSVQEQVDELKRENEALERTICTMKDQLKGERKDRDELSKRLSESCDQNRHVLARNRQLEAEVQQLDQRLHQHEQQSSNLRKHIKGRYMTVGFLRKYVGQHDTTENGQKELVASMESMCERIVREVQTDASIVDKKERISKGEERPALKLPGIPQIMVDCYAMVCARMSELSDARECIEKLEADVAKEKEAHQSLRKESECIQSSLQNEVESLRSRLDQKEDETMKHHANKEALEHQLSEEVRAAASIRSELEVTKESMASLQESKKLVEAEVKSLRSTLDQKEDSSMKLLADNKGLDHRLSSLRSELEVTEQHLVGLRESKKAAEAEAKSLRSRLDQNDQKTMKLDANGTDQSSLKCQLTEESRATESIRSELEATKKILVGLQESKEGIEARASALQTSLKDAVRKAQFLPKREKELLEAQRRITRLEIDLSKEKKSRRKLEDDLSKETRCRERAETEVEKLSRQLEEAEECNSDEEDYNAPQALTQMVGHFSSKVGNDHGEDETRVNDHLSKLRKLLEKQVNDHLKRRFPQFRASEHALHDRNFSLCKKIKYLEHEGRFPKALINAMHDMRMMGNDATHGRRAMERRRVEPIVENFNRLNDMFEQGKLPLEKGSVDVCQPSSRCVRWS